MSFSEKFEKYVKEDYKNGLHKQSDIPIFIRKMITICHIVQRMEEIKALELSEKDLERLIDLGEHLDFLVENINRKK